jgi:hypothetical protein
MCLGVVGSFEGGEKSVCERKRGIVVRYQDIYVQTRTERKATRRRLLLPFKKKKEGSFKLS